MTRRRFIAATMGVLAGIGVVRPRRAPVPRNISAIPEVTDKALAEVYRKAWRKR